MLPGCPNVDAEIVFLSEPEGGRGLPAAVGYSPHIVIQERSARASTVDERGWGNEEYLGVYFVTWPENYTNGSAGQFRMALRYHPRVDYGKVVPGATFTVREGGRIVGHGEVISRLPESRL